MEIINQKFCCQKYLNNTDKWCDTSAANCDVYRKLMLEDVRLTILEIF